MSKLYAHKFLFSTTINTKPDIFPPKIQPISGIQIKSSKRSIQKLDNRKDQGVSIIQISSQIEIIRQGWAIKVVLPIPKPNILDLSLES